MAMFKKGSNMADVVNCSNFNSIPTSHGLQSLNIHSIYCDTSEGFAEFGSLTMITDIDEEDCEIWQFEATGFNQSNIDICSAFENKTKETSLRISGEKVDNFTGKIKSVRMKLSVNTDIYDKWTYQIEDGLLTIVLYEIINEKPNFEFYNTTNNGKEVK